MEKLTEAFVNEGYKTISGVVDKMRDLIRNEVKEKGKITIPRHDEMISPTICYNGGRHPEYASNVFSCVESLSWNEKYNDVMIDCEDGKQLLRDCGIDDVMCLADTLATIDEYGITDDDEDEDYAE